MIILAVTAALGALPLAGTSGEVGPGRVSLHLEFQAHGWTELVVPPLGSVSADTHGVPLGVTARVESIDVEQVQRLATSRQPAATVRRDAERDLAPLVRTVALRSLVVAVLAGALVGAIVPRRRWTSLVLGAGSGLVVTGLLLGASYVRFDPDAFREPRFEGALAGAPDVLAAVQREFPTLSGLQDRIASLSDRLNELYAAAAAPSLMGRDGTVRILHVSDIHLNPLGLVLAGQLAERFEVAAIVDTGDLTSFGYSLEAEIGDMIEDLPVPYYLVPGNHDSMSNRLTLDGLDNLTVLNGTVADINGVRVLGFGDPSFTVDGETTYTQNTLERRAQGPGIAATVMREQPDVLAVAGLQQAEESVGLVPLAISGDIHERRERVEAGTVLLNVGSTGATGLGSFTVDTDLAYEAQVLNFRHGTLVALDYVEMVGVTGSFSVERVVYPATTD